MSGSWPVVSKAISEGRYDLVLSGPEVSKWISESGIDERVYTIKKLKFLEISHTSLEDVSGDISNLADLTQLSLTFNLISKVPEEMCLLKNLHFLDLSDNKLVDLPEGLFKDLHALTTLNVSGNQLERLPSIEGLHTLHELIASKNRIEVLPDGVIQASTISTLDFSYNKLTELPNELGGLNNLKYANFSENKLLTVPPSLSRCRKLHELKLQGNALKDNRLRKLATDVHSSTALLDYLRRMDTSGNKNKKNRTTSATDNSLEADKSSHSVEAVAQPKAPHIVIQRPNEEEAYNVMQSTAVKTGSRPYLLACTVHGVQFKSDADVKAFTREQEMWHRGIGQMRSRATLATHDLAAVRMPLAYTLRSANEVQLHVLNAEKPTTGDAFLLDLIREAELDRKRRKQNELSRLYRYLYLLDLNPKDLRGSAATCSLPIVLDNSQTVISAPPLTNSHQTRISTSTTDLLIEVTGVNLVTCKEFAELVILWLLEHACPSPSANQASAETQLAQSVNNIQLNKTSVSPTAGQLIVRPVRVVDAGNDGNLCVMFPSRLDLTNVKFGTVRP